MLQNRVDPLGNLIRTKARGAWMGTRGLIHNERQEIVRPFKLKAWLICQLEFKNRKRQVMSPKKYTELFFLDEATAFAAGHRPCAECRRDEFNKFKSLWMKGNPKYGFHNKTPIHQIDEVLQAERINKDRSKVTFEKAVDELPDGTFVLWNEQPFLVRDHSLFAWEPFGYTDQIPLPKINKLIVLTPRSIINTFLAGYNPHIVS